MSFISNLIKSIGSFFSKLFHDTEDAFQELPKEQQDAILNGVQTAQIFKDNIGRGKTYVADVLAMQLHLSQDVAEGLVDQLSKDLGFDDIVSGLADKVAAGLTDLAHNALFDNIAKFAAMYLGAGSVNWVTLGLGVVEYAYQWLKGKDALIKTPPAKAADSGPGGSTNPPPPKSTDPK